MAQGGIAAALDPEDSPEEHLQDTLVAGAGLSDPEAVRVLVTEGPDAVRDLIDLGARFDTMADGEISLGREGGHHRNRIAHAGGDATGAEIERALVAAVKQAKDIRLIEHALVLDLLTAEDGSVAGVTLHVMGEGQLDGVGAIRARAVILASGGLGQLYAATTNPSVSTGDGMALALRAGRRCEIWSSSSSIRPCSGWARARKASNRWFPRPSGVRARSWSTTPASGSCRASTSSPTSRRATSWRRRSCGRCLPRQGSCLPGRPALRRRKWRCGSRPSWRPAARTVSTRCGS